MSLWQACALPTASSLRKLGAELQAVVREYGARATPQRNLLVDEGIGRTLSGILSGSDGEHVGPTIETNGDQQALGVTSCRDRKGAEVVDSDGNARTFRDRHGDDWPTGSQPRGFRAWHFKQWRSHHRVHTFMPTYQ